MELISRLRDAGGMRGAHQVMRQARRMIEDESRRLNEEIEQVRKYRPARARPPPPPVVAATATTRCRPAGRSDLTRVASQVHASQRWIRGWTDSLTQLESACHGVLGGTTNEAPTPPPPPPAAAW